MKYFFFFFFSFFLYALSAQQKTADSLILKKIDEFNLTGQKFLYRNADSTRFYLLKSFYLSDNLGLGKSSKLDALDNKLGVLSLLINSDGFHFDLKNLKSDIGQMDSIMINDPKINILSTRQDYQKFLNTNKGNYHFKLNNLSEAKKYFKKVLNIYEVRSDSLSSFDAVTKISLQQYLADLSRKEGKINLAKEYYQKIISDIKRYKISDWKYRLVTVQYRLSRILQTEKKYEEAKKIQLKSLAFFDTEEEKKGASKIIKTIYQILIENYIAQDSIAIALEYIDQTRELYKTDDVLLDKLEVLSGDAFLKKKEYKKAATSYNKGLEIIERYLGEGKHLKVAEVYSKLGALEIAKENPEKALQFYQESLIQVAPSFNTKDIDSNPNPQKVLSKLELIKVLKEKLGALQILHKQNGKTEDLSIALKTAHDIIKTLDLLKPEFESKVDKQFLIEEMYPAFHSMVEIAYDLYAITKDARYIDEAFYFTEKSKSILLLEAARNAQASTFGGVPEAILDQEQQYRANIIHLEKKFFNEKSNMVVFDSLFQLKNKYYNFISSIEKEYPKYYNLKYNAAVVSLEETANNIINNKALLNYFSTDKDLFLITVESNSKNFYKIPLEKEHLDDISQFYTLIPKLNIKDLPEIYKLGNTVYEQLLQAPLQNIKSKELIIIPDGILNYVPFEALSTSKDSSNYLIKDYQISYTNSATLLREQQNKLTAEKNQLVAYAPSFKMNNTAVQENRSDFGPLLHNTDEVDQITKFFNGKAIVGQDASLSSFLENSQRYTMLHFATHAATNDEYPDYSYLAFTPNEQSDTNLLYVKDLYGYTINADLVALSACQTGLGKLQKGEGMLSLARGFSYAGAKSLVTTLWKINDQTTSELMQEFYKNLDQSLAKDKALRDAKLTYLNTADDELLTHPYYWSGFMISGDTTALQTKTSYFRWWLLLLLAVPILLIVVRRAKK